MFSGLLSTAARPMVRPPADPQVTLRYDFAGTRSLIPARGSTVLSFTRATTSGMYFDSSGAGQFASSGEAVFDHDPALNNKSLGYRQFPQYTNEITQSEDFSHADWLTTNSPVITTNVAVAPDGTTTMDSIEDNNGGAHENIFQSVTTSDATTWTASITILKDTDETRFPAIALNYLGGTTQLFHRVQINTKTGAVAEVSGIASPDNFSVFDRGGWWELCITATNNSSGNTTVRALVDPADGTVLGTDGVAATGTATFWGASLTKTSHWAPYVPTTTAAVTVNADSLAAVTDLGWLRDGEGSMVTQGQAIVLDDYQTLMKIADSVGFIDRLDLNITSSGRHSFVMEDGNTTQANMDNVANPLFAFSDFRAAASWQTNSVHHLASGAISDAEDTSATIPANADLDKLEIGGSKFVGWLSSIEYHSRQISGSELETKTLPSPTFDWNPKEDQSLAERIAGVTLTMASGSATFNANGLVVDASNVLAAITDMSWNHQNACTVLVEFVPDSDLGADHVLVEISDGSAGFDNSRTLLVETTSGDIEAVNEVNGTEDARATGVAITNFTTASKAIARFAKDNINVGGGGSSGTADTANAIPYGATQQMTIGVDSAGARHLDGTISRVRIWGNVALPNDTLGDLTA